MRRVGLSVILALSLLVGGCSKDKPNDDPDSAESEAPPEPTTWPLTGVELAEGDSADLEHPVLVVKIDNTESSSPQVGLSKADLVVEELVEGGFTRLAAFYHSELPKKVGPVRSMRASDIGIVAPAKASVVTSGAAVITIKRIQKAGIKFYQEGSVEGITRDTSRYAPYNVMADLTEIAKVAKSKGVPNPYLEFSPDVELPAGKAVRTFQADFGYHSSEWKFTKRGTYENLNSNAGDTDRFVPDSVLVLKVPVGDAGYRDPAGYPVPETLLEEREGKAWLFHDGQMIRLNWSKGKMKDPIQFTSGDEPVSIPAGHVWMELIPAKTGALTWQP